MTTTRLCIFSNADENTQRTTEQVVATMQNHLAQCLSTKKRYYVTNVDEQANGMNAIIVRNGARDE